MFPYAFLCHWAYFAGLIIAPLVKSSHAELLPCSMGPPTELRYLHCLWDIFTCIFSPGMYISHIPGMYIQRKPTLYTIFTGYLILHIWLFTCIFRNPIHPILKLLFFLFFWFPISQSLSTLVSRTFRRHIYLARRSAAQYQAFDAFTRTVGQLCSGSGVAGGYKKSIQKHWPRTLEVSLELCELCNWQGLRVTRWGYWPWSSLVIARHLALSLQKFRANNCRKQATLSSTFQHLPTPSSYHKGWNQFKERNNHATMIVYNWVFCIVLVPPNSDQKQSFPPSLVIVIVSLEYCLQHLVCHFLWLQFSRCQKRPPPWRPSMTWTARWNGWKRCPAEAPVWSQCCDFDRSELGQMAEVSHRGINEYGDIMGHSWNIYIYNLHIHI